jgi:ubiquinone/menaquinone biosynthesis C-methylase UbiE
MKENIFKKWNEEMYKKFSNIKYYYHPNLFVRYVENKRASTILKKIGCKKNDRILDVGCGEGFILNQLNKDSVGIDISQIALKNVKKRYGNKILISGNVENIPIIGGIFDKIICSEVLEHAQHPKKIINEIVRVTVKSGLVVLSIPNEKMINRLKFFVKKIGLDNFLLKDVAETNFKWHLHVFEINEFKKMISKKLEIKEIISIPFRFIPIRYVIVCKVKS